MPYVGLVLFKLLPDSVSCDYKEGVAVEIFAVNQLHLPKVEQRNWRKQNLLYLSKTAALLNRCE